MNLIASLLLLISSGTASVDSTHTNPAHLLDSAESAYEAEDYGVAYDLWQKYANGQSLPSSDLYYNMGNAAWRMDEVGEAIWNWNLALKMDPDMTDAQHNLALAEQRKVDRIEKEELAPLTAVFKAVWSSLSPTGWSILGMVFMFSTALSLVVRRYSEGRIRKFTPAIAVLTFCLCLLSIGLGVTHQYQLDNRLYAVVLGNNVHIKSAPMTGAADAFILHEGTEMKVAQRIGDWYEIRLPDGKVGWVEAEKVGVY